MLEKIGTMPSLMKDSLNSFRHNVEKHMDANIRALILSLYFRPWTLLESEATACVAHLRDLDISVSHARAQRRHLRLQLGPLNNYWERVRGLYLPFESGQVVSCFTSCDTASYYTP